MKKKFLLALLLSSTCLLGACAPNNPEDPNENPPINVPTEEYSFSLTVVGNGNAFAYIDGKSVTSENIKEVAKIGDTITLIATPHSGSEVQDIKLNGTILPLSGAHYAFVLQEGNNDIVVTFEEVETVAKDFSFEILNDTDVKITGYSSSSSTIPNPLTIPDEVIIQDKNYKVTTLGNSFLSGQNVISVVIGKNVNTIESEAFNNTGTLTSIEVNAENTTFTSFEGVLYSKQNVLLKVPTAYSSSKVNVKEGTVEIGAHAFERANRIVEVSLPDTVTKIGDYAFSYTSALSLINFPNSLKEIGEYAFRYNNGIVDLVLPSSLETLGNASFYSSDIHSVKFNSPIKEIPTYSFYFCRNLKSVTFFEGLENIGSEAFISTPITSLTFPSTLKTIGKSAFELCAGLEEIKFNEGLETIDDVAFTRANNITSINLPSTIKNIGINPFSGLVKLGNGTNNFTIDPKNEYFEIVDDVLYSKADHRLISYPYGKQNTSFVVPDGTTELSADSFCYVSNLVEVTLPASITSIKEAFRSMYSEIEDENKPQLKVNYLGTMEEFSKISLQNWHEGTTIEGSVIHCSDGDLESI